MIEQVLLLSILVFFTIITFYLYIWKAKKEVEYKKDERWQFVQLKANNIASYANTILLLVLVVADIVVSFSNWQLSLSFNRVFTLGIFFVGLHSTIEVFALKYYNARL